MEDENPMETPQKGLSVSVSHDPYAEYIPDQIWLQTADENGEILEGSDRTWADHPIRPNDPHYVRAYRLDEDKERVRRMTMGMERLRKAREWWSTYGSVGMTELELGFAVRMLERAEKIMAEHDIENDCPMHADVRGWLDDLRPNIE